MEFVEFFKKYKFIKIKYRFTFVRELNICDITIRLIQNPVYNGYKVEFRGNVSYIKGIFEQTDFEISYLFDSYDEQIIKLDILIKKVVRLNSINHILNFI